MVSENPRLELIANVRKDTKLFKLPPAPTGKRGRPAKKGEKLELQKDIAFTTQVGEYWLGMRKVMTNLFPQLVYVMVTALDRSQPGSYRVFISTLFPEELVLEKQEEAYFCPDVPQEDRKRLLPYSFYSYRWSTETIFYEQKTFWSFGNYMVRKKSGIHLYVNMLAVTYSCVQLLPFHQPQYAHLREESAQVKKQWLGMRIWEEVFFYTVVQSIEKRINYLPILNAFTRWVRRK